MRFNYCNWLMLLLLIISNSTSAANIQQLRLGETKLLNSSDITDIVVTTPAQISAELVADHLVLHATAVGVAEVILFRANTPPEPLRFSITNAVSAQFLAQFDFLQQQIESLQWRSFEQWILVSGTVDEVQEQQIRTTLGDYPEVLIQLQRELAEPPVMIELAVKIAEVKRQFSHQLGVRWPQQISGPLISSSAPSWLDFPVDVQTTIDLLEREGHARLLAEPVLLAQSGDTATFLVGGEIPLPQVLAQGLQDVSFREYGIALNISPKLLEHGQIRTDVSAEISSIDPATAVLGIPGILTRKVSSVITAEHQQSLVLSGLMSHEQSTQTERFPWLHQLPILGELFRSEQFREAQTELVVIVTPTLRTAAVRKSSAALNRLTEFRQHVGCVGLYEIPL